MATQHLDLEEQESIDQLKDFWNRHGKWITALVTAMLFAYASYTGWTLWQNNKAAKAAVLYEEAERAFTAKDAAKVQQAFGDIKERFAGTSYAVQSAFLAAKSAFDLQQWDNAANALQWVLDNASDKGHQDLAALRLASALLESKKYDAAMGLLKRDFGPSFKGLAADRMGDVLTLQGKEAESVDAYKNALTMLEQDNPYRLMVEVKLSRLGVDPQNIKPAGSTK